MKRLVGIVLGTPTDLGPALGDYREMCRISRADLARQIAERTGRAIPSVNAQLRGWETGGHPAVGATLTAALDILGCNLALIPKGDS
jgi:hypothetical protein